MAGAHIYSICLDDCSLGGQGKSCFHPQSNVLWWADLWRFSPGRLPLHVHRYLERRPPSYLRSQAHQNHGGSLHFNILGRALGCHPVVSSIVQELVGPFPQHQSRHTLTGIRSLGENEYCSIQTSKFGLLWVSILHLLSEAMGTYFPPLWPLALETDPTPTHPQS